MHKCLCVCVRGVRFWFVIAFVLFCNHIVYVYLFVCADIIWKSVVQIKGIQNGNKTTHLCFSKPKYQSGLKFLLYILGILNDETYANILSNLMQFLIDHPRRYVGWCYDKWSKSLLIWDDTGATENTSVHLSTPYDQFVLCSHRFQIE